MSQKNTGIGELRYRVTISRLKFTSDGMGGSIRTSETIGTVWAKVTVPSSATGMIADANTETRSHFVRIRQNATTLGVDINDIVTWRGWNLRVKGVRPDGQEWIDLDCVVSEP